MCVITEVKRQRVGDVHCWCQATAACGSCSLWSKYLKPNTPVANERCSLLFNVDREVDVSNIPDDGGGAWSDALVQRRTRACEVRVGRAAIDG